MMPKKSNHDLLTSRRRQLCQDMGRMAWPDEARAARDEIMAIDEEIGCHDPR